MPDWRICIGGLAFLLLSAACNAQAAVPESCTTTEPIRFASVTSIPPALDRKKVREAVLVALGFADVDVSWAKRTFKGQWFFEIEDNEALYAGYAVRSHYLRVAILIDPDNVTTIVCDSRNLKQTEKAIHRKVPGWKGTLDTNIRIALGQASAYYSNHPITEEEGGMVDKLNNLESLHRAGVLTEQEYKQLRQRVIASYESG